MARPHNLNRDSQSLLRLETTLETIAPGLNEGFVSDLVSHSHLRWMDRAGGWVSVVVATVEVVVVEGSMKSKGRQLTWLDH